MSERKRLKSTEDIGSYFTKDKKNLEFIPSGCVLLDLVLGGGWALGRISNVVGDNSSGKTLTAIEASVNFAIKYPEGKIYYVETEAAFDKQYAEALGVPLDRIIFVRDIYPEVKTVEGLFNFLKKVMLPTLKKLKNIPVLVIVDTQDALGCTVENEREIDKGTFNQEKNRVLNRLYRELTEKLEKANVHFMVISQTRDNIGVTFGRKWRVTGEGSLKFFASQRIQLAEAGKMKKMIKGVERPYGVKVKAQCFKNKVGLPFRTCSFPLYFGYGIDNNEASLDFLKSIKALKDLDIEGYDLDEKKDFNNLVVYLREVGDVKIEKKITILTKKLWNEIETEFLPKRRKY